MNNEHFYTAYSLWFCRTTCPLICSWSFWLVSRPRRSNTAHNCEMQFSQTLTVLLQRAARGGSTAELREAMDGLYSYFVFLST